MPNHASIARGQVHCDGSCGWGPSHRRCLRCAIRLAHFHPSFALALAASMPSSSFLTCDPHNCWHCTGQREKHKELNGTVCIYSPYLNSIKTIQQGRRLPLKSAVEDPTAWEILQVFHCVPAPCVRLPRDAALLCQLSSGELYSGRDAVQ